MVISQQNLERARHRTPPSSNCSRHGKQPVLPNGQDKAVYCRMAPGQPGPNGAPFPG
jgi:hypothetical protein